MALAVPPDPSRMMISANALFRPSLLVMTRFAVASETSPKSVEVIHAPASPCEFEAIDTLLSAMTAPSSSMVMMPTKERPPHLRPGPVWGTHAAA